MEIDLYDIVRHILNIAVLYLIVRTLLYKPVRKFMLAREEGIANQIEQARQTVREADALHDEYKHSMANAEQETRILLQKSTTQADVAFHEIIEKAEKQAADILENAQAQAEQHKKDTMREMKQEVSDMAVEIASRILEREVSQADNQRIIDEFFAGCAK